MIKVRFICKHCGHRFIAEIFEPGEKEEKKLPSGQVRCPKCKSSSIARD